jgi:hypothetical protein
MSVELHSAIDNPNSSIAVVLDLRVGMDGGWSVDRESWKLLLLGDSENGRPSKDIVMEDV